MGTDI